MLKILLVSPKTKFKFVDFPLSLSYLKQTIDDLNIETDTRIFDLNTVSDDFSQIILKHSPDIIGVTATKPLTSSALKLAELSKSILDQVVLIAGGPQPSISPDEFLNHYDIVVRGEGEITICKILESLKNNTGIKEISGISYKYNGEFVHNKKRQYVKNLDSINFPNRELLSNYVEHTFKGLQIVPIISSRGCPYKCIFCTKEIFGNMIRYRSPSNVIEEMNKIKCEHDKIVFQFRDDTFTSDRKRVVDFCKKIINGRLNHQWLCNTRADLVDKDLLKIMSKAGCKRISLGAESGDDEILKIIKKGITTRQTLKVTEWAHQAGMDVKYFLMVGIPGQTKHSVEKTISLVKNGKPDDIYCSVFVPFPGTNAWDNREKLGIKLLFDPNDIFEWEKIYYQSNLNFEQAYPPIETDTMSVDDIIYFRNKIFDTYFSIH